MTLVQVVDLSKIILNEFWQPALSNGGNIRFTNSANAVIPLHLVDFNKTTKKGIAFAANDASGIRAWVGTGDTSQPAAASANGQYDTYDDDTLAVWISGIGTDATSSQIDLTDVGGSVTTTTDGDYFTDLPVSVRDFGLPYNYYNNSIVTGSQCTYEIWFRLDELNPDSGASLMQISHNAGIDSTDTTVYSVLSLLATAGSGSNFVLVGTYERFKQDNNFDPFDEPDRVFNWATVTQIVSGDLEFGVWHHAAFKWQADGTISLLVDGTDTGTPSGPIQQATSINGDVPGEYLAFANLDVTGPLFVGATGWSNNYGSPPFNPPASDFSGAIGLTAVYSVAQTDGWAQSRHAMLAGQVEAAFVSLAWPN